MQPSDTMPNFLTMDFATVTVQIKDAEFVVHKAFLTAVSPYLEKASNGPFRESEQQAITLEGVSKSSFRNFLQWVYANSLQFDTKSAALDHSAVLPPDDVNNSTASTSGDDAAAEESDSDDETTSTGSSGHIVDPIQGASMFDEEAFHPLKGDEDKYCNDERWLPKSKAFYRSVARLFILADKYSVPQLRDDILTALVGQCWKWNWWPDEDELASLIYDSLPASFKFVKFLACSIAWVGMIFGDEDPAQKMEAIRELNPDLAFEIGLNYAVKARGQKALKMSVDNSDPILNSCLFHDHTHSTEEQCRKRIASKPHVFTAILDACAKEALSLSMENDG